MLREKELYTEEELSVLLSQARDLSGQLEFTLLAARRAVRDGNQGVADNCVKRANTSPTDDNAAESDLDESDG